MLSLRYIVLVLCLDISLAWIRFRQPVSRRNYLQQTLMERLQNCGGTEVAIFNLPSSKWHFTCQFVLRKVFIYAKFLRFIVHIVSQIIHSQKDVHSRTNVAKFCRREHFWIGSNRQPTRLLGTRIYAPLDQESNLSFTYLPIKTLSLRYTPCTYECGSPCRSTVPTMRTRRAHGSMVPTMGTRRVRGCTVPTMGTCWDRVCTVPGMGTRQDRGSNVQTLVRRHAHQAA